MSMVNQSLTAQKVIKVIADELKVDVEKLVPNASFAADLGADSLERVGLVMALEDEFGLNITEEQAQKILTVQDAIAYVETRVDNAAE